MATTSYEIWATVARDSRYDVSDQGHVRMAATLRHLTPRKLPTGYLRVSLGRNSDVYIHHLVLEAFIGPRPDGCEASHINGKNGDNRLVNLAWETAKQNNGRKNEHGTALFGSRNPMGAKTHCKRGHEFTPENTRYGVQASSGGVRRICRVCARTWMKARRAERRRDVHSGQPTIFTEANQAKIAKWLREGLSVAQIAQQLDCHPGTIRRVYTAPVLQALRERRKPPALQLHSRHKRR